MTAHFAGAGPNRARRRRRLILSNTTDEPVPSNCAKRQAAGTGDSSNSPERTRVVTAFNSLIRPQPWVNWLIVAAGFAMWAGVIQIGSTIDRSESGFKDVLGLKAGRLSQFFMAACLLGATQLSLVILWYRTQSRKDFQGRYRVWIWSSFTWGLLFSAAISGWHIACSQWFASRLPLRLRTLTDLLWLFPAAMLVGTTFRLLSREVARSHPNRWLLRIAFATGGLVFLIDADPDLITFQRAEEFRSGCCSLWAFLTASVLLHHARYVIHVSNEVLPRERHQGQLSPIIQQVWVEVLSLAPSRGTIARSLAPGQLWNRLRQVVHLAWRVTTTVKDALSRIGRRETQSPTLTPKRRKEDSPLPAPASEPRPKANGKSSTKSTKAV
jgi:hypothetical protein